MTAICRISIKSRLALIFLVEPTPNPFLIKISLPKCHPPSALSNPPPQIPECSSDNNDIRASQSTRRARFEGEAEIRGVSSPAGAEMASRIFFSSALMVLLVLPSLCAAEFHSKANLGDDPVNTCVYTVYVRTGTVWKGGTDSVISVKLGTPDDRISIPNLETWGGMMEPGHDYFERGNLDIFSGRGPCLSAVPCYLELISDGTGSGHGWYCNYVEVTITGPHLGCGQQQFTVEDWLATDRSPYNLTAVRDYCTTSGVGAVGHALV